MRQMRDPRTSTAAAGITQLIVAATVGTTGHFGASFWLPAAFGIGDIMAATNKDSQPNLNQKTKSHDPLGSTIKDVLATAENYFAYGLSRGQGALANVAFFTAAGFATARNIPFVSQQLDRMGTLGHVLKNPYATFGLLAAGCVVAAKTSNLHVGISYMAFGVAYLVIPTFKSGGLYEAISNRFKPQATPA